MEEHKTAWLFFASLAPPNLKDVHLHLSHPFHYRKGFFLLKVLWLQSIVSIPCWRENLCAVKPWGGKGSKAEVNRCLVDDPWRIKGACSVDSPWERVSSPVAVEAHQRLHVFVAQLVVKRLTESSVQWGKRTRPHTLTLSWRRNIKFQNEQRSPWYFPWSDGATLTWQQQLFSSEFGIWWEPDGWTWWMSFVALLFFTHNASAWMCYQ